MGIVEKATLDDTLTPPEGEPRSDGAVFLPQRKPMLA